VLATDGFWACPGAQAWLARGPATLTGDARLALDRLFDDIGANPPPALHPDNITAIVLRSAGEIAYSLPIHGPASIS
jgi:hypothetical protein